jgi:hypothetical protein
MGIHRVRIVDTLASCPKRQAASAGARSGLAGKQPVAPAGFLDAGQLPMQNNWRCERMKRLPWLTAIDAWHCSPIELRAST